ncbi:hypothetical protein PHJA_002137500 [Phtheirospermum japonicum]|uniref:Uncharacterized protein n=1 Tax=Phtheirospermum japonicum TaxID=374723 RepID=A0A830CUR0_9LAMI|nr:hypothetical protein PHJA_002137500 [Phtheirospermum japonicum]
MNLVALPESQGGAVEGRAEVVRAYKEEILLISNNSSTEVIIELGAIWKVALLNQIHSLPTKPFLPGYHLRKDLYLKFDKSFDGDPMKIQGIINQQNHFWEIDLVNARNNGKRWLSSVSPPEGGYLEEITKPEDYVGPKFQELAFSLEHKRQEELDDYRANTTWSGGGPISQTPQGEASGTTCQYLLYNGLRFAACAPGIPAGVPTRESYKYLSPKAEGGMSFLLILFWKTPQALTDLSIGEVSTGKPPVVLSNPFLWCRFRKF